ncbi:MAG: hypothetical protein AB7T59_19230 [Hyphomonadaceae bacterium]
MLTAVADANIWAFFNTREWAIAIWLVVAIVFACIVAGKQVLAVLRAALNQQFVGAALVFFAYVAFAVFIYQRAGLWDWPQLKTTLLWAVFVAPSMLARMVAKEEQPTLIRVWIKDTVGALILVELVLNTYTFSIWVELMLVPFLAFIGLMLGVAQSKPKYHLVSGFFNGLLAIVGLGLLVRGVWMVVANWSSFVTLATLRDFYTAPLMSLTLIPFLYAFYLFVRYQNAFAPMRLTIPDPKLRDYAMTMAMLRFHARPPLVRRWQRELHRVRPKNRAEVVASMNAVLRRHARELNPPAVDAAVGWCPVAAGKFLASEGVVVDDYREGYAGQWQAESLFGRGERGYSPHTISYSIEGDEASARELLLRLYVDGPENGDAETAVFKRAGALLLNLTLSAADAAKARPLFEAGTPFAIAGATNVTLEREDFAINNYKGYELRLVLTRTAIAASAKL